nr:hypothetical protein GCM10020092_072170 [Actinoplanes digitatis]
MARLIAASGTASTAGSHFGLCPVAFARSQVCSVISLVYITAAAAPGIGPHGSFTGSAEHGGVGPDALHVAAGVRPRGRPLAVGDVGGEVLHGEEVAAGTEHRDPAQDGDQVVAHLPDVVVRARRDVLVLLGPHAGEDVAGELDGALQGRARISARSGIRIRCVVGGLRHAAIVTSRIGHLLASFARPMCGRTVRDEG